MDGDPASLKAWAGPKAPLGCRSAWYDRQGSIYDLLHPELPLRQPGARLGIVPLGIPMIVGPAVLTALPTVARTHGYAVTLIAFALNLVIVWAALRWAFLLGRVLGDAGSRAVAKVFNLVLAAIAVTFIRRGVLAALGKD